MLAELVLSTGSPELVAKLCNCRAKILAGAVVKVVGKLKAPDPNAVFPGAPAGRTADTNVGIDVRMLLTTGVALGN